MYFLDDEYFIYLQKNTIYNMEIALLGTGNMAWHLARAIEKSGHRITDIYARDSTKAIQFAASLYDSKINQDLDFSESTAEIFILCVSDDAIEEVCSKILLPENAIIVHTSGAKSLEVLSSTLKIYHDLKTNSGVFYPLMTFTKGKEIDFKLVPVCIEAENTETEDFLIKLGKDISNDIYLVNSSERAVLHVAAVFSCNFSNHLWAISKEIVESEELDFEMLKPLIAETFKKAMAAKHPADVQTGPAIRGDQDTLATHLNYLKDDEDLTKVYQTLTESIQDWHES